MKILIIGNLGGYFSKASQIAITQGATVSMVTSVDQALLKLSTGNSFNILMVDVNIDISALILDLNAQHISIPIIACGINSDKDLAVKAIRAGAREYLPLPPDENIIAAILSGISATNKLIYRSQVMQEIVDVATIIAQSNATVLITGKSGTGKEALSQYIHAQSNRKDKNFVCINCAAIPENLLESELFGHEKGAFTGAIAKRIGKFEESNNGTLLLDEISEIDLRLQAKLLRAIQEQEIDRVGGNKAIKLNLRIIATSNRDLKKEVAQGRFREDLYFRLNVINIELPNLSERLEDIELFAHFFNEKYCKMNNLPLKRINQRCLDLFKSYHWPGNIREFENMMYRTILLSPTIELSENIIEKFIYNSKIDASQNHSLVGMTLAEMEKKLISSTLHHYIGDQTTVANILGLSINKLKEKISAYEIETSKA